MDRTERFYKIEELLQDRRVVSFADLRAALEVSPSTVKRDLRYLQDRLDAPIRWDAEAGGYRWNAAGGSEKGLPGPWFTASEIHALLTLEQLLSRLDPAGVLALRLGPLRARLTRLLDDGDAEALELRRRVRVVGLASRRVEPRHFQRVGTALVTRRRLRIRYLARSTSQVSEREVSPLRLIHYRENWHLDAWCHERKALRNFSVDAIQEAQVTELVAHEVSDLTLDAFFHASYGIFAGMRVRWARLRFSPERARWVANEEWHPDQKGRWDRAGHWLLDVPYADPRELLMDILRHVPDVQVLGPPGLRNEVVRRLREGLTQYDMLDK